MNTILIPDSAPDRFSGKARVEETKINERGQAGAALTHGASVVEMVMVVRHASRSRAKQRRG